MRVRPVEANLDWTTLTDPTDMLQLSNTVLHSSSNSVTLTILPELIKSQVRNLVGKIPWRRERLPTPVFLPGEFHGLCSLWGHKSWTQLSDFHYLDDSYVL